MSGKTDRKFDVIIAGAGPAGTSAAIRLASAGVGVLLAEQKKFPRPKLCGEFISPECDVHFKQLGVSNRMGESGAVFLGETVFFSARGYSVAVPSRWFGAGALGLSRARMDNILLQRAREVGVTVLEETQVVAPLFEGSRVCGARLKSGTEAAEYQAGIIIDATGRARALARRVQRVGKADTRSRPTLLAFKAHLRNADVSKQTCEIYFFPGGYGGISCIEDDLSNLCFIAPAKDVRRCGSDPEKVIREVVWKNSRAAETLAPARVESAWLGVSLEGFGRRDAVPAEGLLAAGDAAAFIDPFTGSGILMALEAGKLAAETIVDHLPRLMSGDDFKSLENHYRAAYAGTFNTRLRVCALLRTAAFFPGLAGAAILFFGANEKLRKRLAISTRPEQLLD